MDKIQIYGQKEGAGIAPRAIIAVVGSEGARFSEPIGWVAENGSVIITEPGNLQIFMAKIAKENLEDFQKEGEGKKRAIIAQIGVNIIITSEGEVGEVVFNQLIGWVKNDFVIITEPENLQSFLTQVGHETLVNIQERLTATALELPLKKILQMRRNT